MRIVLVGSAARRRELRARLPDDVEVVTEAATLAAAKESGRGVDAYLVAAPVIVDDAPLVEPLTRREVQVLELTAAGLANKAIAAALAISDETVKFHLGSVFGKLGASNRTDAVRLALRRGLIAI
jgi:DNA-binding NarL/FixJ family response regulator